MTDLLSPFPDPPDRAALYAALLANGTETGWWDEDGHPALWPDDTDEWTLASVVGTGPR
jgi:hypothetical protein